MKGSDLQIHQTQNVNAREYCCWWRLRVVVIFNSFILLGWSYRVLLGHSFFTATHLSLLPNLLHSCKFCSFFFIFLWFSYDFRQLPVNHFSHFDLKGDSVVNIVCGSSSSVRGSVMFGHLHLHLQVLWVRDGGIVDNPATWRKSLWRFGVKKIHIETSRN